MGVVWQLLLGRPDGLRASVRGRLRRLLTRPGHGDLDPDESDVAPPVGVGAPSAFEPPSGLEIPAGYQPVLHLDDMAPGSLREVFLQGRSVALARVGETVHAVDGTCPHAGGPLAEGSLDGTTLTCPAHGWSFDVATGACHVNPEDRIHVLAVQVVRGVVCLPL